MIYGPERLKCDLGALGYQVTIVSAENKAYVVVAGYEILVGQFAGRVIDLGIPAPPNFPNAAGAAIHVRANPQPFEKSDSVPNVRNILDSPLGPDWRYWSHTFGQGPHTTEALMAKINGIFRDV